MDKPAWLAALKRFETRDPRRAVGQLLASVTPYLALFALMYLELRADLPYWLVLATALPAAGFLVRIFIILHDCGHGSFSASPRVNAAVGYLCGVLTFTAFPDFRRGHARHHATVGNLDRRGEGDVWTLTLEEYRAAGVARRALYRFTRNPPALFLLLAPLRFFVLDRFPAKGARRSDILGVLGIDLALAGLAALAAATIGPRAYVAIQLPTMWIAATAGVWLFFVQHQYPKVYWAREADWDRTEASLRGSSFYDLPAPLRWFSGNIGFHHVHHLDPRIPNYRLKEAAEALPETRVATRLTWKTAFRSLGLALYDEAAGELIGFREARRRLGKAAG